MSSYIQVLYGYCKVSDQIQFLTPKNVEENQYLNRIGYISNKDDPVVKNNILDAIKNRKDLQKWILATSDFGRELQQDINEITGGDEKFNNAVLRCALDLKSDGVFRNPQPISLLFNDVEKFHQQNPIIGKLATQINVSKLSKKDLVKRQFLQSGIAEIENRLHRLKYGKNDKKDDDDDDEPKSPPKGGSRAPPTREAEIDPSFRRPPKSEDNPERDLEKVFKELRFGKTKKDDSERDLEKVFKELRFGKTKKDDSERDLQKVFRELRFGKIKPEKPPPDPFHPDFWKEVYKDPQETIEDKIEQDIIDQRENFDASDLPSPPLFDPETHEKTQDSFARPVTELLDGETIEITPKIQIREEK